MGDPLRQQTVLIVDDIPDNLTVLNEILKDHYRIQAATDGATALRLAAAEPQPDLILLDIMMPLMDGYQVCRQLKADLHTRSIPVIFVTAKTEEADETQGFELGAVDYITKPVNPSIVRARVATQLALYDQSRVLEQKVRQRTLELHATRLEIIRRLGRAAEYKDNETGLHVVRMSWYSKLIGQAIGLNSQELDLLFQAAPMHDVGKIGIPDAILLKPGKLDEQEWQQMLRHPEIGAGIIGDDESELLQLARTVALTHHEKFDGSGYPNRLSGEDIPIQGRIVAIADVFDALTTARPYKAAWEVDKAVALIQQQSGSHFDPALVPHFIKCLPQILQIRERFAETSSASSGQRPGYH